MAKFEERVGSAGLNEDLTYYFPNYGEWWTVPQLWRGGFARGGGLVSASWSPPPSMLLFSEAMGRLLTLPLLLLLRGRVLRLS